MNETMIIIVVVGVVLIALVVTVGRIVRRARGRGVSHHGASRGDSGTTVAANSHDKRESDFSDSTDSGSDSGSDGGGGGGE